ncbi:hypothetical protein OOT46_19680 [Aquabacterium sp. A7-Y]|uniref:hypothetical protein n=1 Tax=Aquabacterium sp. A7-Y TaxID=1349605 RepID=UPI00223E1EC1|nr:hypothetical protein [Aquabacterium sp. A7-Y]MCW7540062.1 hypothetical protein [Aquabacterium sp. A7-Y]
MNLLHSLTVPAAAVIGALLCSTTEVRAQGVPQTFQCEEGGIPRATYPNHTYYLAKAVFCIAADGAGNWKASVGNNDENNRSGTLPGWPSVRKGHVQLKYTRYRYCDTHIADSPDLQLWKMGMTTVTGWTPYWAAGQYCAIWWYVDDDGTHQMGQIHDFEF